MATVETARDVEIQRALVEIQQRLQDIDAQPDRENRERVRLWREGWRIFWQGIAATAAVFAAGGIIGGVIVHLLHL